MRALLRFQTLEMGATATVKNVINKTCRMGFHRHFLRKENLQQQQG